MKQDLYPFQKETVKRCLEFLILNPEHSCYNASEMGLGKTVETVELAERLADHLGKGSPLPNKSKFRALVVCPAVMRHTWEKEIHTWTTHDNWQTLIHEASSRHYDYPDAGFVIVSYAIIDAPGFLRHVRVWKPDFLILDEAHYVKNSKAIRSVAAFQSLWPICPFRLALSGTPFTNRVVDGYTLFHRMNPDAFPNWTDFTEKYSYQKIIRLPYGRQATQYFGVKNAEDLREKIRSSFYVRYTKKEVLPQLPEKIFQTIWLPQSFSIKADNKRQAEELKVQTHMVRRAIEKNMTFPIPATLAEHRRLQGEAKADAVADFAVDLLDNKVPLVIFAYHLGVIERLRLALAAAGYDITPLTGQTPDNKRKLIIENFQEGKTPVFLGQIQAAGTGITLTRASTLILAELDWNPAVIKQSIDRLHRIGQQNVVLVYDFRVKDSIDEAITGTLISKVKDFKAVLEN